MTDEEPCEDWLGLLERETGPEEVLSPPTLHIVSSSTEEHRGDMLDRIQRWEQDDAVPHVISFEDPNHLKQIFSPHRIDIIRHLLNNSNVDIPELAKNLGQAVEETKDDIQLLEKYKIIFYREKDKNTKIYIPYENVKIENMWVLSSR